jgi:hypothetical protein
MGLKSRPKLPRKARRRDPKIVNNVPEHILFGALYHPEVSQREPAND